MATLETSQLREIAESLLDERSSPDSLTRTCRSYFELLSRVAADHAIGSSIHDTPLPRGAALSPAGAAACIEDPLRTAMFVRGVRAAVDLLLRRFRGECIEIVYAGTGPFASLALPIMALFSPDDLRFTMIDVHKDSIECLRSLLERFAFEPFVRRFVNADATTYVHPPDEPLHLVISETLQQALSVEPQVGITRQLAPQITPGGLLVPEKITVDFVFEDPIVFGTTEVDRLHRTRTFIGRAFTLDATVGDLVERDGLLPLCEFEIPDVPETSVPAYITEIHVFGDLRLKDRDSGLTCPYPVPNVEPLNAGDRVALYYDYAKWAGIRIRKIAVGSDGDNHRRDVHSGQLAGVL